MSRRVTSQNDSPTEQAGNGDFFDASFLAELEELAGGAAIDLAPHPLSSVLEEQLARFERPEGAEALLTADAFAALPDQAFAERTNTLVEICRESPRRHAGRAVESFIVFFQALDPGLDDDGSHQMRRLFFRLVPTLLHIAWHDFSRARERRDAGIAALRSLERVLLEVSSVRLTPNESDLVFRSIDQMTAFIAVGEYHMATELISSQLLSIIERNRLTRALYRLMEVEVSVQRYLKHKRGYPTPQIRLPEDVEALADYGPVRILHEGEGAGQRRFIQVQLPDIPILRDVVLHLVPMETGVGCDLRFDALGSAELSVPDGSYEIGLVYQPETETGNA